MKRPSTFEELTSVLKGRSIVFEGKPIKESFAIEQIGKMIPGIVMLQDYYAQSLTFINDWGCQYLNRTLEELRQMGVAYFNTYLHPQDVEENLPKLIDLLNGNDYNRMISFFLRVRKSEQDEWKWFFHTAKLFEHGMEAASPREVIITAIPVQNLSNEGVKFTKFLDENEFKKRSCEKFESLTKREKEIMGLVASGNNSKKISELLYISETTVETHRKNIRKKIGAGSIYEIVLFAQAFDLI